MGKWFRGRKEDRDRGRQEQQNPGGDPAQDRPWYIIPGNTDKVNAIAAIVDRYVAKKYAGKFNQLLGIEGTTYCVSGDSLQRKSELPVDTMIVTTAACLAGGQVSLADQAAVAEKAYDAVRHYASLDVVQGFFLLPYYVRKGVVVPGASVPREEQCRLYSAVESLLLEIYDELPDRGRITDDLVVKKVKGLAASDLTHDNQSDHETAAHP